MPQSAIAASKSARPKATPPECAAPRKKIRAKNINIYKICRWKK